jgi:DNA-binding NtrC family response regulator
MKSMAKTVLLVEDNPDVLEVTACMLEDAGYEVICANTPEQAREAASARSDIGVVVTDLNLTHGSSGIEMGMDMRRNGLDCPLLVVSGDMRPELATKYDWMGYLPKPYNREALLRKITELACGR